MTKASAALIFEDKGTTEKYLREEMSLRGAFVYFFSARVYFSRGDIMSKNKNDRIPFELEKPIPSGIYPVIDTDLARDNLENDIPAADLNSV